jgi:hypothetical protein
MRSWQKSRDSPRRSSVARGAKSQHGAGPRFHAGPCGQDLIRNNAGSRPGRNLSRVVPATSRLRVRFRNLTAGALSVRSQSGRRRQRGTVRLAFQSAVSAVISYDIAGEQWPLQVLGDLYKTASPQRTDRNLPPDGYRLQPMPFFEMSRYFASAEVWASALPEYTTSRGCRGSRLAREPVESSRGVS